MKVHRGTNCIHIDLSSAEAMVLLDELENVRGGAKLVKLRQVCEGLKQSLALEASMAPRKSGRPKSTALVSIPIPNRVAQMALDPKAIARNAEGLRRACEENED